MARLERIKCVWPGDNYIDFFLLTMCGFLFLLLCGNIHLCEHFLHLEVVEEIHVGF